MIIKERCRPVELEIMKYLNVRGKLTETEAKNYSVLIKGYEGEIKFDKWVEHLLCDCLILNDLLLEYDHNVFQIDTLLITYETIYLINVKNYEGDFYFESGKWFTLYRSEIKDPLLQLKRSDYLLQQLIRSLGFPHYSIEALLVFINPHFHLYQSSMNLPIIFPSQLERFKHKLEKQKAKLNNRHSKIAKLLISLHKPKSIYTHIPDYDYDQLQKGIVCSSCHFLNLNLNIDKLICKECGAVEAVDLAVLRSVEEFKLLFPEMKVTTHIIHEWCAVIKSKKTIRRILKTNFNPIGYGSSSYYVNK
ncbi:nuclease-related domain-containing protein [Cytobacillus sp.]|uniref:nuclease-related domain-containing protein n=1 Tax=Cytobacillus sp. TaxID=2675269 RepID=UPI0028BE63F2|nr:nuclease-related domain-containing protein [Cytobacillus sp.]